MMSDLPLIQLTEAAAAHISQVMKQNAASAFRLDVKQTGCSGYMYVPEVVNDAAQDDVTVHTPQDIVVLLAAKCVDIVRGTEIDFVQKNLGMEQLVFNNPNAESECGCGESFNLKDDARDE